MIETVLLLFLGEACLWKAGVNSAATKKSFAYSTCTGSLSSCNDGLCDQLERVDQSLCPQDCVEKGYER